jgi:dipeptidyl aminopeptidase/acylaminoacyl peptidase
MLAAHATPSRLVWVTDDGTELRTLADGEDFGHLALSPDGTRAAVSIRERGAAGAGIWIIDLANGTRTRLTSDSADDVAPLWSPDSRRVAFASWRNRAYDLYEKASDGTGAESVIVSAPGEQIASNWTERRGFILYQTNQPGAVTGANPDLWARSWPLRGRPFAFLRTVHAASRRRRRLTRSRRRGGGAPRFSMWIREGGWCPCRSRSPEPQQFRESRRHAPNYC